MADWLGSYLWSNFKWVQFLLSLPSSFCGYGRMLRRNLAKIEIESWILSTRSKKGEADDAQDDVDDRRLRKDCEVGCSEEEDCRHSSSG